MSELSKVDIYKQIDVLRQSLLDLTMRNQLLNFRPRTMTVEVKDAELAEIYDRLVLKQTKTKLLQFIPRGESILSNSEDEIDTNSEKKEIEKLPSTDDKSKSEGESPLNVDNEIKISDLSFKTDENLVDDVQARINDEVEEKISVNVSSASTEDIPSNSDDAISHDTFEELSQPNSSEDELSSEQTALLWESPPLDQEILEKNKEIFLSTDLTPSELQRRLFYINQRARSVMEEQGYNILYLAVGFLKWKEENGSNGFKEAPILLIPVELERKRVKGSFKLRWTGEDIITNISLQAKLVDNGVEIPDFEMPRTKEGVDKYLEQIAQSISHEKGWEVIPKVFLGFFSSRNL